jgi:DNA-binding transcriptional ArsR family regulator
LDNDGVDIYVGTRRNKDEREKELGMMKQAQDDAPVGGDSTPNSREIDTALRQLKRKPDADTLDYEDLQRFVKGRSKKEPEVFITVDASIRRDIAKALKAVGAIKRAAVTNKIKAAVDAASEKMVDRFAASKKKQTPRQARIIAARELKKAGIEDLEFDDFKPIVKVFQDYGLVRPGELTPGRKRKRKGAEKPAPPTGNPPPSRGSDEVRAARDSMRRAREEAGLAERLGDLDHVTDAAHKQLFENLVKRFTK